tara:strand:+ start:282 stop:584 length:303 start_codon:yes stop_codon:yes gene_type:complete
MAKRKTPKTEKVIDLAPKAEKITDEQLVRVKNIVNRINRAQLEIGMMESRKHALLHDIAGTQDELTLMQTELEKDYGTFDIDVVSGKINYPENGEANKKD